MKIKNTRKFISFIVVLTMVLTTAIPAFGANSTSKSVKLNSTTGTVTVKKGATNVNASSGMRILDGYSVITAAKSYAFLELDNSKFAKLDQNSNVKIKKKGATNELQIAAGSLFFNVKKPLKDNESLKVKTSNITMSVRGTTGTVSSTPVYDASGKLLRIVVNTQIYTGAGYIEWENEKNGDKGETVITPNQQLIINIDQSTGNQTIQTKALDADGKDIPASSLEELLNDKDIQDTLTKNLNTEIDKLQDSLKNAIDEEKIKTDELISSLEKAKDDFLKVPEQVIPTEKTDTHDITVAEKETPATGGGGGGGGGSVAESANNIQSSAKLLSYLSANTSSGADPISLTITGNVNLSPSTAMLFSYGNVGADDTPEPPAPSISTTYYNVTINIARGATFNASGVGFTMDGASAIINNGTLILGTCSVFSVDNRNNLEIKKITDGESSFYELKSNNTFVNNGIVSAEITNILGTFINNHEIGPLTVSGGSLTISGDSGATIGAIVLKNGSLNVQKDLAEQIIIAGETSIVINSGVTIKEIVISDESAQLSLNNSGTIAEKINCNNGDTSSTLKFITNVGTIASLDNFDPPPTTGVTYTSVDEMWKVPVALIDDTKYYTLEEALASAGALDTVQLIKDYTLTSNATLNSGVTLAVNSDTTLTIGNNCTFTIWGTLQLLGIVNGGGLNSKLQTNSPNNITGNTANFPSGTLVGTSYKWNTSSSKWDLDVS